MLSKVVKFWHSLFPPSPELPQDPQPDAAAHDVARKHHSAIAVRTALRQKQKLSKASP